MRMMFKGFAAAVIAVGLTTAAHAETKPGAPASAATSQAEPDAKPVKDKRYCVTGTTTGSRLARKACRTRAEWLSEGFDPLDPK